VLSLLQAKFQKAGKGINFMIEDDLIRGFGKLKEIKPPTVKLSSQISVAGAIQLIEEKTPIRFVVRDYGIVPMVVTQIPQDAYLLNRFIHPEIESDFGDKQKKK